MPAELFAIFMLTSVKKNNYDLKVTALIDFSVPEITLYASSLYWLGYSVLFYWYFLFLNKQCFRLTGSILR